MNKYVKITLSTVVVVGLIAGGVKTLKDAKAKDAAESVAKVYPIVAQTLSLESKNVELTLPYPAQVANDKDVKLASKIPARASSSWRKVVCSISVVPRGIPVSS